MSKRILIVEDDISLYNMYAAELTLKGYEVSNIPDGSMAFEGIKTRKPDLVLLDLMLPKKNGLDILQEVKGDDQLKATRVVMLTNFGNDENISRALELGAEDYIMKYNIVPSELSEKVSSILGDSPNTAVKFLG